MKRTKRAARTMPADRRGHGAAHHFVRCRLAAPGDALLAPGVPGKIRWALGILQSRGEIEIHYGTLMADSLELVLTLGARVGLGDVVARVQVATRVSVHAAGADWGEGFHGHRIGAAGHAGLFARYLYMKPYLAGLVEHHEEWRYWMLNSVLHPEFEDRLIHRCLPPREWWGRPPESYGLTREMIGEREGN